MVNYTKSFANRNSIETLRKFLEKFFLETQAIVDCVVVCEADSNDHTFEDTYLRSLEIDKSSELLEE